LYEEKLMKQMKLYKLHNKIRRKRKSC